MALLSGGNQIAVKTIQGESSHKLDKSRQWELAENDTTAAINLTGLYENGILINKDYMQALHYYSIAANQGDAESQYEVWEVYRLSVGVAADVDTARHYYMYASNQKHELASKALAEMTRGPTNTSLVRLRTI